MDLFLVTYTCCFQMDVLERDALEVVRLVRSAKNSLAPINRIPPEVFSLIPDYICGRRRADRILVRLTHVCRSWRDTLISRSSLWARLDFADIGKTSTYIRRSQSFPLTFHITRSTFVSRAFALVIPHIHRLKYLGIYAYPDTATLLTQLYRHMHLLKRLDIDAHASNLDLDRAHFSGDLSLLRELRLSGMMTNLPQGHDLAKLRVLNLELPCNSFGTTHILDLLGSAPLLQTVFLKCTMPKASDAPPGRMVPLRHLKDCTIKTGWRYSTLLDHLQIPIGTSLVSRFDWRSKKSPLLGYLPERPPNLENLSDITAINLCFDQKQKFTQLSGPSGSLRVLALRGSNGSSSSYDLDRTILQSLGLPILSTTQRLGISEYKHSGPAQVEECPIFQTLSSTSHLQSLTLIDCDNGPFTRALDPEQNSSKMVLCTNMEELVLYVQNRTLLNVEHLVMMAKNRSSRGARLSSIRLVDLGGVGRREEILQLREDVTRVGCRVGKTPAWDQIPDESGRRAAIWFAK